MGVPGQRLVWDRQRARLVVIPSGGSGEPPPPPEGDPPSGKEGGQAGGSDDVKTVTQSQLSSMLAREKNQGREAASRELSEQLGMSIEEAKQVLEAARKRDDEAKSEAQKAKDAADRERQEAETAKQSAARERHEAAVERALIRAGVSPDDDAKLERVTRMITVDVGADTEAIKADVTELKEKFPEIFAAKGEGGEGGGGKPPPSSDPKAKPPKGKQTADALSRGAERAKAFTSGGVTFDPRKDENVGT